MPRPNIKVPDVHKELAHKQGITKQQGSSNVSSVVSPTSTRDQLCCSIPIVIAITRGSHIFSHRGINDHCKKEKKKPHMKTDTSKESKLK